MPALQLPRQARMRRPRVGGPHIVGSGADGGQRGRRSLLVATVLRGLGLGALEAVDPVAVALGERVLGGDFHAVAFVVVDGDAGALAKVFHLDDFDVVGEDDVALHDCGGGDGNHRG